MRISSAAMLAAMLVACGDDSQQPTAPAQSGGDRDEPASAAAAVAVATTPGVTRGFYVDGFPNGGSSISIGTTFTRIQVYRGLPAGKYIATASAALNSNGTDLHPVTCIFTLNGVLRGETARATLGGHIGDDAVSLPLTIGFTITGSTNLGVACATDAAGVVFTEASPITAIRVDQLTTQHP